MKKFILAGLFALPFMASATTVHVEQGSNDKPTRAEAKKPTGKNLNLCQYDGKDYTEGALINDSGVRLQCVNNNKSVFRDGETPFDMRWERVPENG